MTNRSARTSRTLASMIPTFKRLADHLRQAGANLSIWTEQGVRAGSFRPMNDFCSTMYDPAGPCEQAMRQLAGQVLAENAPAHGRADPGCCVIGVPVYHRRRLIGAALGCFPIHQMRDEEALARLCDRMRVDHQLVAGYAEEACRHRAECAECMLRMLGNLLRAEHTVQVAHDELATLSVNLATTYEELSLLYRISGSMRVTQRPADFLQDVCNELLEVMNIRVAAALVYAHPPAIREDLVVFAGSNGLGAGEIHALAGRHVLPAFEKDLRAVVDNHFAPPGLPQAVHNLIAVPLTNEDRIIGAMIGLDKQVGEFDSVDLKLISSIGNQAAGFLANNRLYADLQDLLMGVLHALTATIDAKDPYTCGHSQRVALISKRLAEETGFEPDRAQRLYLSGLLHDIGKIGIPESTLRKEGRLTDEEYDDVKRHPAVGAKILGGIRQLDDVIDGIVQHHERLDGRGYPKGLVGDEISVDGRIVGLADSFDAMTSDRTYRGALPLEDVIREIRDHAGTQFDPDLARTFLSLDLAELLREMRQPVEGLFALPRSQDYPQ